MGDYTGPYGGWKGEGAVTAYEGLKQRLNGKAEVVLHAPGADAVELARTCDVALFFAGIKEGEGQDRSLLALPADQEQMIAALAAGGVKTVVILQNGSTVDIRNWIDKVDAVLEAWYSGEQGGTAIAEALMGDVNPGGRLPISWPRHVGQVPMYYAIKPSGRGYGYHDDDGKPIFPFGYGLSYAKFEYSRLELPDRLSRGQNVDVAVTVTNTGKVSGDEVVQVYVHDEKASVVRPLRELKAFRRVTLAPGESRRVVLSLPYRSFAFWNAEMKLCVEAGAFQVAVGLNAEKMVLEKQMYVE